MKTKEQLAEQYAEEQNSAYTNDYYGFLAGYEAAEPKWISVETPPDNDREVLIYVRDHKIPWWSNVQFGSYLNQKWYLRGGIKEEYELVKWAEIPQEEEIKTVAEWLKIFNKIIILDNDEFKEGEKISERDFTNRLARCTTNI